MWDSREEAQDSQDVVKGELFASLATFRGYLS